MNDEQRFEKFKELIEDNVLTEETIDTLPCKMLGYLSTSREFHPHGMCMCTYWDGDYFHQLVFINGTVSDITLFQDCFEPGNFLEVVKQFGPYLIRLHDEIKRNETRRQLTNILGGNDSVTGTKQS